MSKNIDACMALQAIKNAVRKQNPDCTSLILHSDLGPQYTSNEVKKYLKNKGIRHSYSKKGYPYDNAPQECEDIERKKLASTFINLCKIK